MTRRVSLRIVLIASLFLLSFAGIRPSAAQSSLPYWTEIPQGGAVPADAETAYWLRRAVLAWARRLPWRALCFEQGLAAFVLLRGRGLDATLHYGAATIGGELKAHVWVTSGPTDVVGCENQEDYGLLARFPS